MDAPRFDNLAHALQRHTPRRAALGALGGGLAALLTRFGIEEIAAKKGKNKKKKPKLNEFGCVNVGGKCRGKDSLCCSGICQGKKPKKGQKDKSRCVAHDEGLGCSPGMQVGFCAGGTTIACTTSTGDPGLCDTTTGNAAYCTGDGECLRCTKDQDCVAFCGEGAACARCEIGCAANGGTVCVGRSPGSCVPPI